MLIYNISAFRKELTEENNLIRHDGLKYFAKQAGLTFKECQGSFEGVHELSIQIETEYGKTKVAQFCLDMANLYDQVCFLFTNEYNQGFLVDRKLKTAHIGTRTIDENAIDYTVVDGFKYSYK